MLKCVVALKSLKVNVSLKYLFLFLDLFFSVFLFLLYYPCNVSYAYKNLWKWLWFSSGLKQEGKKIIQQTLNINREMENENIKSKTQSKGQSVTGWKVKKKTFTFAVLFC